MHGWAAWNSRSHSEPQRGSERERRARARARARPFPFLALLACGTQHGHDPRPKIADEPITQEAIEWVAERDGISHEAARAHVVETLRWAAAAKAARPPDVPELDSARRDHLRRTTLARLWLADVFAASHRREDIPADDPLIGRARGDSRNTHPEIYEVCQAVFKPEASDDPAAAEIAAADPRWRAAALVRADAFAEHTRRTVPPDDPEACTIFANHARFEPKTGDGVELDIQGAGGFQLDACAQKDDDGGCKSPKFAPEWTSVVGHGPIPGLRGPFLTRFGVHVALVARVLPATPTEPAAQLEHLRGAVHDAWRARELALRLQALRTEKAGHVAVPGEAPP